MTLEAHPIASIFPRMNEDDLASLEADIRKRGLLEAIWLYEGKILDGRHRYAACCAGGVEPQFREYEGDDAVGFVVSLNLKRRHLNESQRQMVAANITTLSRGDNQHTPNGGTSQAQAAKLLNTSERGVQRAAVVKREGAIELVAAVQSGKVSVSAAADVATLPKRVQQEIVAKGEREILQAAKAIRAEKSEVRRAEIAAIKAANPIEIPSGKYSCIVIDPPWEMQKIERDVRPNQVGFDYPTMSEEELSNFNLAGMAADDCHLFCWTTHKHLPLALRLVEKWGFRYVCTLVWHKSGGFQPIGLPQYNCEFVLYARRGTPEFVDTKAFPCCFEAPRREHSRKPDEFYSTVLRVTQAPRIDVFSREHRNGFSQFGNEVSKFGEAA